MATSLAQRLNAATYYLQSVLKLMCPFDLGNLSMNGINVAQITPEHYQIIIGGEVAKYALWTDVRWIPANHGGHSNPNEGWVEGVIRLCEPFIRQIMSGTLDYNDVMNVVEANKMAFEQQVKNIADGRGLVYAD